MNEIEKYHVNIDFDESSRVWRENKRVLKNGMFSYKKDKKNCCHYDDDGKRCRKKKLINDDYCEKHFK
jgi:hypothetical protein